jgi:hypothetical protein
MTKITQTEIDAKGARFAELQAEIAERQAELDTLKLEMQQWPIDSYVAAGAFQVQVQAWRKRDDAAFQDVHPFESYPELYKFVLDTAAIKNEVAPVDLEPFMRQQAPKVLVKPLAAAK